MLNLKPAYPVHLSDKDTECCILVWTTIQIHQYLITISLISRTNTSHADDIKIHKDDISQACKPQRGVDGVCKYYIFDESKIIPNFVK